MENFTEIESKAKRLEALIRLSNNIREKEKREPIPFNDFLFMAGSQPQLVFRDIFQLFHDMLHHFVPEGTDDFKRDTEHIGFVNYDMSKMFLDGCDEPFFADRLFANRLMNLADNFRKAAQNNRIYIFEGPPGSGKSTFLNNILQKFEDYTKTPEGATYKTYWRLDVRKLGGFQAIDSQVFTAEEENGKPAGLRPMKLPERYLEFSCPNHDHPILQIPKEFRRQFLDELIHDNAFKEKLFNDKEYEWVLKDSPCSICNSIQNSLMDRLGDPLMVFNMLSARKNYFNRQLGEGISVFNPGDKTIDYTLSRPTLQYLINDLLRSDDVKFNFSYLAKTNSGILALMDIKEKNIERLKNYHGIISDGVHKVELTEEHIKTFFLGLVNPEDKVHYEEVKSFQDRIITVKIPYILDYNTEVSIYRKKFGDKISTKFLPMVLQNFAKIIISSRLELDTPELKAWIDKPYQYTKYLDKNMLLLKMDVYAGRLPEWINETDLKRFDRNTRKAIISATDREGFKGISGRKSIIVFNNFFSKYADDDRLITMEDVIKFFTERKDLSEHPIPADFLKKLEDLYDYNVLQEVKEAVYFYNEKQISADIQDYLFAINFDFGEVKRSEYTGNKFEISEDYFSNFEARILGKSNTELNRKNLRKDTHSQYITETLSREIRLEGKKITDTKLYKNLFDKYTRQLKENALVPYNDNENFRRAILDYGTGSFNSYDDRVKRDVNLLITNLGNKFGYSETGAKQVSVYVLDKNLAKKYS